MPGERAGQSRRYPPIVFHVLASALCSLPAVIREAPVRVLFGGEFADEVCGSVFTVPDWALPEELASAVGAEWLSQPPKEVDVTVMTPVVARLALPAAQGGRLLAVALPDPAWYLCGFPAGAAAVPVLTVRLSLTVSKECGLGGKANFRCCNEGAHAIY